MQAGSNKVTNAKPAGVLDEEFNSGPEDWKAASCLTPDQAGTLLTILPAGSDFVYWVTKESLALDRLGQPGLDRVAAILDAAARAGDGVLYQRRIAEPGRNGRGNGETTDEGRIVITEYRFRKSARQQF